MDNFKSCSKQDILVSSAENYYNYVGRKRLSTIVYKIKTVSYDEKDNILQLQLEKKTDKWEMSYFLIKGREFTSPQIQFIEYDDENNIVKLRPMEEVLHFILPLSPEDIFVIVDLKYLIKRVQKWHENNADIISLPKSPSSISPNAAVSNIQAPSNIQNQAIRHIFSVPFSYIWGAPGTGKTSIVLAHSILQYMKQMPGGRKLLLCAPTNNALEQSLFSILPLLEKNNISLSKVRRLGMPSKHFRNRYPMCCEFSSNDNNADVLYHELEEIQTEIYICSAYDFVHNLLSLQSALNTLISFKEQLIISYQNYIETDKAITALKKESGEISDQISAIESQIFILTHKQYSFWAKTFRKRIIKEDAVRLNSLSNLKEALCARSQELSISLTALNNSLPATHSDYLKQNTDFQNLITEIRTSYRTLPKIGRVISSFTDKDIPKLFNKINALLPEYKNYLIEHGQDYKETLKYDRNALARQKNEIELQIEKYQSEKELREYSISLVACTLDRFCAEYSENNFLPFPMHVFLDEAGYANLCKTLCLFGMNCPVTFLGDHMQLPPVFEIADERDLTLPNMQNTFLWGMSALHVETFFQNTQEELWQIYKSGTAPNFNLMLKKDLTETYRFSKNLTAILDKHIYKNGFSSLSSGNTIIKSINAFTGANKERYNIAEIDCIEKYINNNPNEDFVILTPYKKQVDKLNERFPDLAAAEKILTVHKSQGREWDTVIFSVVDTTNLWFTDSKSTISNGKKVLNTAISRAKKKLVIVCDEGIWLQKTSQLITDLIKKSSI